MFGLSIHKSDSIERLRNEVVILREQAKELKQTGGIHESEIADLQQKFQMSKTDEDFDLESKRKIIVDKIKNFGDSDFSEIACWLLASSLNDHKIINQRLDETSLLWRTTKMSGGRILEVGRAGGGSTVAILGASNDREVISIDRYPQHAEIVDRVFERNDVKDRLTLLTRSSRDEIDCDEFGMLFIDGDHTYEGVCHDIAYFWNKLKSIDGKPALAVFHDAAENPIAHVPEVSRACKELAEDKNVAKVLESWGSMLLLEKVGDIDPNIWHAKEDKDFWKQLSGNENLIQIMPRDQTSSKKREIPKIEVLEKDYLGADNFDDPSWKLKGFSMEPATIFADSPLRLLKENASAEENSFYKDITLNESINKYRLTTHLRPIGIQLVHVCLETDTTDTPMFIDFRLDKEYTAINQVSSKNLKVNDINLNYKNGFFCCEINLLKISDKVDYKLSIGSGLFSNGEYSNEIQDRFIVLNAVSIRGCREI